MANKALDPLKILVVAPIIMRELRENEADKDTVIALVATIVSDLKPGLSNGEALHWARLTFDAVGDKFMADYHKAQGTDQELAAFCSTVKATLNEVIREEEASGKRRS